MVLQRFKSGSQMLDGGFANTNIMTPLEGLVDSKVAFANPNGNFDASRVLQRMGTTLTPKVAIMGDSTSLPNGNDSIGVMDNLWGYLMTRLREDNPEKTFTFGNYAIGGSTMTSYASTGVTLAAAGLTLPSWFSPTSSTWISFVQAFAPDVLFLNWGINDAYTFVTQTNIALLTAVNAWTKVPDIIYITNKGSNQSVGGTHVEPRYVYGRANAAALMRTIAESNARGFGISGLPNIGCLDIGRSFSIASDGYDPEMQELRVVAGPIAGITEFPYEMEHSDGDLWLDFTITAASADILATSGKFYVGLGDPNGSTGASSFIEFSTTNGTTFFANYYGGASVAVVQGNLNNWVDGDNRVQIHVSGSRLYVTTNGSACIDAQVVRYAGPFTPSIYLVNPWAGCEMTLNQVAVGNYIYTKPILTELETYGPLYGSGGGINHDTSLALNSIDRRLLQRTNFRPNLGLTRTVTAAGAITVTRNDRTIFVNKTVGAATTVNLPAQPIPGVMLVVKDAKGDAGANNITITPASGNIDGSATLVLSTNYAAARIVYDGTQWYSC